MKPLVIKPLVIVGCGSKKAATACAARELYTGPLFKASLAYALSIAEESDIRIFSAKHGLVELDTVLEPYDVSYTNGDGIGNIEVAEQMPADWRYRSYIMLCGINYQAVLIAAHGLAFDVFPKYTLPIQGLGMGKRIKWLKENTK